MSLITGLYCRTFMISASAALSSVIVTMICLGICIDGSHRLRLDRITVKKSVMRNTATETVKYLWDRVRGRHTEGRRNANGTGERAPLLRDREGRNVRNNERRGSPNRNATT